MFVLQKVEWKLHLLQYKCSGATSSHSNHTLYVGYFGTLSAPVIITVGITNCWVQALFHKTLIVENITGKKSNFSGCRKLSFYALSPLSPFSSQGSNIALIINCSISLSTGCLLVLIIAFHYKDIRVSFCHFSFISVWMPLLWCGVCPSECQRVGVHRCIVDLQGLTCHILCITFHTSKVCSKLASSEWYVVIDTWGQLF